MPRRLRLYPSPKFATCKFRPSLKGRVSYSFIFPDTTSAYSSFVSGTYSGLLLCRM